MRSTLVSLRKRQGIEYGEDVPLIRTTIPEWFVARLKYWAASAGMETFPEQREGHMTVVLGGKVLVIDIDFLVDRKRPDNPMIDIATLKTSFAVPNSTLNSTTDGSVCLDGSLADSLRAFLREVHKDEEVQDTLVATKYGVRFQEHLKYLMKLDKLAFREGDRGLRWFSSVDRLATSILEPLAVKEAQAIVS